MGRFPRMALTGAFLLLTACQSGPAHLLGAITLDHAVPVQASRLYPDNALERAASDTQIFTPDVAGEQHASLHTAEKVAIQPCVGTHGRRQQLPS